MGEISSRESRLPHRMVSCIHEGGGGGFPRTLDPVHRPEPGKPSSRGKKLAAVRMKNRISSVIRKHCKGLGKCLEDPQEKETQKRRHRKGDTFFPTQNMNEL